MSMERQAGLGPRIVRARGRRTDELLQRRELSGEVKGALICMGLAAGNSLASVALAMFLLIAHDPRAMREPLLAIGLSHGSAVAVLGTLMLGLWKRTAWAYWGTIVIFGLGAVGGFLGAFYWFITPAGLDFFSSPFGLVAALIMAGLCLTPVLLLARARGRYFSPPARDERSV